jgi:hypothetical protein
MQPVSVQSHLGLIRRLLLQSLALTSSIVIGFISEATVSKPELPFSSRAQLENPAGTIC